MTLILIRPGQGTGPATPPPSVVATSGGLVARQHVVIQPGDLRIRLVQRGMEDPDSKFDALGTSFGASWRGINGNQGFQSGTYETRLNDEGRFDIRFPNAAGEDGRMHIDRFLITSAEGFRPGDEFVEIWREHDLLFVGCVVSAQVSKDSIILSGYDALYLLRKQRETESGVWVASALDLARFYSSAWRFYATDDFSATTIAYSTTENYSADGKWRALRALTVTSETPEETQVVLRANGVGSSQQSYLSLAAPLTGNGRRDQHARLEARVTVYGSLSQSNTLTMTIATQESAGTPPQPINAGFESSVVSIPGPWVNDLGTISQSSAFAIEGSYSAALTNNASGSFAVHCIGFTNTPWPAAGSLVRLTYKARRVETSFPFAMALATSINVYTPGGSIPGTNLISQSLVYDQIPTDSWATVSIDFPMPELTGSQTLSISLSRATGFGGATVLGPANSVSMYVDDFELIALDPMETAIRLNKSPKDVDAIQVSNAAGTRLYTDTTHYNGRTYDLAIEVRGRWAYFYVDGGLVRVLYADRIYAFQPKIALAATSETAAYIDHIAFRRAEAFIADGSDGDYRLPDSLTTDGLVGIHRTTESIETEIPGAPSAENVYLPTDTGDFPTGLYPSLHRDMILASSLPTKRIASRYTGSIYLDLEESDYRLWIFQQGRARVWVGKTAFDDTYFDRWNTTGGPASGGWLRSHLGTRSGWYPIIVEVYSDLGQPQVSLFYEKSGLTNYRTLVNASATMDAHKVGDYIPTRPLHYYVLDDPERNNTVTTFGSNATNGTFYPSDTASVRPGPFRGEYCYDFSGSGTYIDCGNVAGFSGTASFSVTGWFQVDSSSGTMALASKMDNATAGASGTDGWMIWLTGSADNWVLNFRREGNGTAVGLASPVGSIKTGQWHHFAVTFGSNQMWVYIDRVPVNIIGSNLSIGTNSTPLYIGRLPTTYAGTDAYFNGGIAHVAVWDYALNLLQVGVLYDAGRKYGEVRLSPLGVFDGRFRYESFGEIIRDHLSGTFGLQYTLEPRSLESGSFPGALVINKRIGRDTNKVLDRHEGVDIGLTINAEDVVDNLVGDGAGLADMRSLAALSVEMIDYANVEDRFVVHSDYEQSGDITIPSLLATRLTSLRALRDTAWTEVSARPRGFRELVDSFPVTGDLAEFAWEPGDALRLWFPEIGVRDATPRQILGVQRAFYPHGLGEINVSFKQRPRSFKDHMRKIQNALLHHSRNYQRQLATFSSPLAANGNPAPTYPTTANPYAGAASSIAQVSIPRGATVVEARVNVTAKESTGSWTLAINGTAALTNVTSVGSYDVTAFAREQSATVRSISVQMTDAQATEAYIAYMLVLTVSF